MSEELCLGIIKYLIKTLQIDWYLIYIVAKQLKVNVYCVCKNKTQTRPNVSAYNQEMPQSQAADHPMSPSGRHTEQ